LRLIGGDPGLGKRGVEHGRVFPRPEGPALVLAQAPGFPGNLAQRLLGGLGAQRVRQAGEHDAAFRCGQHGPGIQAPCLVLLARRQDQRQFGGFKRLCAGGKQRVSRRFERIMRRFERLLAGQPVPRQQGQHRPRFCPQEKHRAGFRNSHAAAIKGEFQCIENVSIHAHAC